MRLSIGSNGIHQIEEFAELYPRENNYLDRDKLVEISKLKRVNRENYKINNFRPNITSFIRNNVEPVTIRNNRNCSDPENQSEVYVALTEGGYPEEISWFLFDLESGLSIFPSDSIAPFDTTLCLPNGYYTIEGSDSYGDGWNGAVMTITDISNGFEYLDFTVVTGSEAIETFYLGPISGCTDLSLIHI